MLRELPEDMESRLGYRIAYGEAARLFEMAQFDHGWVRTSRRGGRCGRAGSVAAGQPEDSSQDRQAGGPGRPRAPQAEVVRVPAVAHTRFFATSSIVVGAFPSSRLLTNSAGRDLPLQRLPGDLDHPLRAPSFGSWIARTARRT